MTLEDYNAGLVAIRAVCEIESHQVTFNKLAPGANLEMTVAAMRNKWNNRMVIPFYQLWIQYWLCLQSHSIPSWAPA